MLKPCFDGTLFQKRLWVSCNDNIILELLLILHNENWNKSTGKHRNNAPTENG